MVTHYGSHSAAATKLRELLDELVPVVAQNSKSDAGVYAGVSSKDAHARKTVLRTVPNLSVLQASEGTPSPALEKSLTEERQSLMPAKIVDALQRLADCPLMSDVATANPDWAVALGPFLGSIPDFVAKLASGPGGSGAGGADSSSVENLILSDHVDEDLLDMHRENFFGQFLEVRAGFFLRIAESDSSYKQDCDRVEKLQAFYSMGKLRHSPGCRSRFSSSTFTPRLERNST